MQGSPAPQDPHDGSLNDSGCDSDSEPESQTAGSRKQKQIPKLSEYELAREANKARNMKMARQIDDKFRAQYDGLLPEQSTSKPARKKRERKTRGKGTEGLALRSSARISGSIGM
jgi:hypothetical protein